MYTVQSWSEVHSYYILNTLIILWFVDSWKTCQLGNLLSAVRGCFVIVYLYLDELNWLAKQLVYRNSHSVKILIYNVKVSCVHSPINLFYLLNTYTFIYNCCKKGLTLSSISGICIFVLSCIFESSYCSGYICKLIKATFYLKVFNVSFYRFFDIGNRRDIGNEHF